MLVNIRVRIHALPWNQRDYVKVEPPDQQHREIQRPKTSMPFILMNVRLHGYRCNHRDQMYEQHDVSGKKIRHVFAHQDFEITPQRLIKKPGPRAQRHQSPKNARTPVTLLYHWKERYGPREEQHQLSQIAGGNLCISMQG